MEEIQNYHRSCMFFQAVPNTYRSLKCVSEYTIFFVVVSLKAISGKPEEV